MKHADLRERESVRVFKNGLFAGELSRTKRGAQFVYDESFRQKKLDQKHYGISFSMPHSQSVYETTGINLHPFFAGLLPEGLRLKALKQQLKTSEDDLFSMLLALGSNCIGDVYVQSESCRLLDETGTEFPQFDAAEPSAVSFTELFEHSISRGDQAMREIDSGIPGVIPKISASMISFPVSLAKRNKQYLLKLGTSEHPQLLQNEYFFMQLAQTCGFTTAPTTLVQDRDGMWGLLIERFDRTYDKQAKTMVRHHQEDACQFLDYYPQDKYRLSLREIAEGIQQLATSPIVEIQKLLMLYVFSYLIGNGDLHAKNISLLEDSAGRIRLSPVYDMLSTLPYGDRKMALRLGAKDENFSTQDVVAFAELFNLPAKAVKSSLAKLLEKSSAKINALQQIGLPKKESSDLLRTFKERAKKLTAI